jgi:hypothetical protein
MIYNFAEEFEHELNDSIYYVEVVGSRELDEMGRIFAEASKFVVTDELGNELTDNDDAFNEILEYVLYDRHYDWEATGWAEYDEVI